MSQSFVCENGGVLVSSSTTASVFGTLQLGAAWNASLGKSQMQLLDRGALGNNSGAASHFENYTLDVVNAFEEGIEVNAVVPAAATGNYKIGIGANISTQATNASAIQGQATAVAVGINSVAASTGTVAAASIQGVQAQALVGSASDAVAAGALITITNNGLSAVTNPYAAFSKNVLYLGSAGTAKNSSFCLASKQIGGPSAINATHGFVVDNSSVDTSSFALTSGQSATLVWAMDPNGKELATTSAVSIASGTNTATITHPKATVTFTGFTTAAVTVGATNTVTATGLCTANTQFRYTIQSYAGTYHTNGAPSLVNFVAGAGSFTFAVYNFDATNALSGNFVAFIELIN